MKQTKDFPFHCSSHLYKHNTDKDCDIIFGLCILLRGLRYRMTKKYVTVAVLSIKAAGGTLFLQRRKACSVSLLRQTYVHSYYKQTKC